MMTLEDLKRAFYARRFGTTEAHRMVAIERKVGDLSPSLRNDPDFQRYLRWVEGIAEEERLTAMELYFEREALLTAREDVVRVITARSRASRRLDDLKAKGAKNDLLRAAERELRSLSERLALAKEETVQRESAWSEAQNSLHSRVGRPPWGWR